MKSMQNVFLPKQNKSTNNPEGHKRETHFYHTAANFDDKKQPEYKEWQKHF